MKKNQEYYFDRIKAEKNDSSITILQLIMQYVVNKFCYSEMQLSAYQNNGIVAN
jgi:hypothetical protein